MATYGFAICACVMNLSIGSYLYGIAYSKAIKGSLFTINQSIQAQADPSILLEQLTEFLELHSNAKQLSEHKSLNTFDK